MNLGQALSWVFDVINELFYHFRGLFFSLGFDIVAFIVTSYGVLAVMRMITNGGFSLSKTIDIPENGSQDTPDRQPDHDPWNPARQYSIFDYDDISKS